MHMLSMSRSLYFTPLASMPVTWSSATTPSFSSSHSKVAPQARATARVRSYQRPSVNFMMFALQIDVTVLRLLSAAYLNAARAMSRVPG